MKKARLVVVRGNPGLRKASQIVVSFDDIDAFVMGVDEVKTILVRPGKHQLRIRRGRFVQSRKHDVHISSGGTIVFFVREFPRMVAVILAVFVSIWITSEVRESIGFLKTIAIVLFVGLIANSTKYFMFLKRSEKFEGLDL